MGIGTLAVQLVLVALAALGATQQGEQPVVAEVQVVGGSTISAETVEYYLGVVEGDPYDPEAISGNFRRFWDAGLAEELLVESEEIEPGKVRLIVTVKERPRVSQFVFEGNKKISTSDLKEALDTAGLPLRRESPLRVSELQRVKQAIKEKYAEEGYASATVEILTEDAGPSSRKVTFSIDEGVKVRIGEVRFEGNQVYSDRRLRGSMKKLKTRSLYRLWGKKLIWNKAAWGEDSENVKKFYMNRGYKDIVVGEPQVELVARNPNAPTQKKKKFRMIVTIPVQEGDQFRLGSLRVQGSTVFDDEVLRKLYDVKLGKRYKYSLIEAGNESVQELYQSRGYIYAYTNQALIDSPEEDDVTDVVINVYEGDRYRLGRIEFKGNTKTQDKVLRREFRLFEGSWMNMSAFRRSVFKMNQLGYFKLTEDPLKFDFDENQRLVNVTISGNEVGRTDIQFGAGYSELDKFFAQFMFNTRNFLGRGEILGLSVQSGQRADTYSLSFTEPYFLDRRMLLGASIYKQSLTYNQSYDLYDYFRDAQGGSIVWGLGVGDFGQLSFIYGYENVSAKYSVERAGFPGSGPRFPHRRPLPTPYEGIPQAPPYYETYSGVTSSITPSYFFDSRDDPFDPNQGLTFSSRIRTAGGPLGGDFNYLRPEVGGSYFYPWKRRFILAANFEAGLIHPYSDSEIPTYDRYRLGGERSLRGFGYYSVLPRTAEGLYFYSPGGAVLGGDRYVQLNLEYQIKVGGPLKFILFADIGNTWHEAQGWDLSLLRQSTGVELRIFLPMFQAPLRFIYGINLDPFPDEKRADFQFSIGSTF